ncbi:ABC transporter ATP-binding protein [Testudinibacter sp. TR-2022]|uniref:ABC transporter ATP-binding protein n=1 Tax=Testudinibacter sp. TR-2022 TaxID=2585029 RepID=UPI00111A3754|nr:ABC transporter ATP-binding protein [Testudinibacter sp. TR-2022]TNH03395.1 ABC transporter ATP-binding protein [Pasteurellaceae bacterium Phil31]TNH04933.1 ABC transporter ATP-binding protein [Testudinibacter sp. TR-2022]TNH08428.1 ABC transporter ATP-binding protein [Testudinibacter sp. TR-2022]TNH14387.1 ABC transporter ATP-binding protein [Testudinibacter sp. TR-2022]TNH20910.1 ABC transporter ATP-binding protein [Testudinibacter sp. TR-2022]
MIFFTDLTLKRGLTTLLEHANATINPGQKVGLVGKNGCGKSSLLSLLKGEMSSEGGEVKFPSNWSLAWVNQETPALDISALDYVIQGDREYIQLSQELAQANADNDGNQIALLHAKLDTIDAWTIQSRAATLLHGLGFENQQLQSAVKSFSGGWRMRLNLAQALICRSDLLLLDEPTNHLDLDAVIWLERWLSRYPGTLILISHDRDFLDPVVSKILHIEQQQLNEYSGDYSSFEVQRATKLAQQNALYHQQQQKVEHLQSYIDRFRAKASKAKQAQSRIRALERMELIAPAYVDNPFKFEFRPPVSLPNPILSMEKVSAGYADHTVLQSVKLNLVPGSRIGLLGRNGAGKSTLIKLLAEELTPQSGMVQLAKGVQLGYFAQHQLDTLRADETALWHLARLAPQQTEQQLRDYLGGFAFHGDKVKQAVDSFSGGEKARLVLALIVWQRPNLLLLDEPTNHLDLDMRQALTEALVDYQGSLVVVSHDRHLLRNTVNDFYLVHDHKVEDFDGDLDDYQKWLNDNANQTVDKTTESAIEKTDNSLNRKEQKRLEAELRQQSAPLRQALRKLETQLEQHSTQLSEIENQLADTALYQEENKVRLTTLLDQQVKHKKALEQVEFDWLEAQQQLEELLNQAVNL